MYFIIEFISPLDVKLLGTGGSPRVDQFFKILEYKIIYIVLYIIIITNK